MQRRIRGNQADERESTDLPWKRSRERPCFLQLNLWVGCVGAGCCDCNEVVSGLSQKWSLPAARACRKVVWWTFLKLPDAPKSVWFGDCSRGWNSIQGSNKVSRMALFGGVGLEDGFQCEHYGLAYVVSRIQCGWFLGYASATAQETILQHLAAQPGAGRIRTPTHPSKQTTIKTQAAATTSIKTTTQPPPQPRQAQARHHTTAAQKQCADAKLRPFQIGSLVPVESARW